jgi:transcriptional regulator with XRE-family HTH domain
MAVISMTFMNWANKDKVHEVRDDPAVRLSKEVANALRLKREQLGISQNELSQRCHLSRTGLRAIELGINSPTFVSLFRIANALGVSLGEIVAELEKRQER